MKCEVCGQYESERGVPIIACQPFGAGNGVIKICQDCQSDIRAGNPVEIEHMGIRHITSYGALVAIPEWVDAPYSWAMSGCPEREDNGSVRTYIVIVNTPTRIGYDAAMLGVDGPEYCENTVLVVLAKTRGQARAIAADELDIEFIHPMSIRLAKMQAPYAWCGVCDYRDSLCREIADREG